MTMPAGLATSWVGRHLAAVLLGAAFVLFGAAIFIGLSLDGSDPHKIHLEGVKALATIATGLLLGGVVKIATDNHADAKKRRDEATKRLDALIADMHHNHDRLETTRLLIAAHRSARTYSERMRDVIDAHVVLLKIARVPGMGVLEPDENDLTHLESMLAYLVALQDEYRDNYIAVSNLQRYDEEVTKQTFAREAKLLLEQGEGVEADPPQPSGRAWKLLHDTGTFPVLEDLCHRGTEYGTCFLACCTALSRKLAEAKATARLLPAPPKEPLRSEAELRERVERKADEITTRCRAEWLQQADGEQSGDGSVHQARV